MSSIDERTVKMQFDNDLFMKRAKDTQKTMADVNKSVDSAGKSKGLLDLNSNMEKVSVTASKMAVVTTTALATIANKVTNVGINLAKSLTFDPIKQGFSEYESLLTKQNTIMNATGKSAKVVKGYLNQLNSYSDQTIYSFGNMTESITKFVNAGVPLPRAVTSIKGIANAAAFAGASTEEANRAMFAFSQSMQTGFIMLNDWQQIENANMGTIQFKEQLLKAAVAAGTLTKKGNEFVTKSGKVISATKGWRDGLQEQWATTGVLNAALGKYADKTTVLGKKAFAAAQDVRTFSAFMDTLKESIGSGWSQIFTSLFGNLKQSTKMWTGLSNAVGGVVQSFFGFATTTLKTWRQMGGFQKTIQGFKNLLAPFGALLRAIGDAWSAAFPNSGKGAGKALYGLSAGFEAVTRPLQLLASGITALTPALTVFFQLIKISGTLIKRAGEEIGEFVGNALGLVDLKAPSSGGFLGFVKKIASAIADAVDQIDDLLSKGSSLKDAFGSVDIDLPSIPKLPSFGSSDSGDKAKSSAASASGQIASGYEAAASRVKAAAKSVKDGASDMASDAQSAGSVILNIFGKIGEVISYVWNALGGFFDDFTADDVIAGFNLAVLSTLAISIARFLNTITGSINGFAGSGKLFKELLEGAGDALGSFQTQARAKLILNIGIAIGILAASLWLLSRIPKDKLVTALGALGALFFMLNVTMKNMTATLKSTDGVVKGFNFIALAAGIMILGAAMILLATACLIMNKVEWQSIAKGIITMAAAMAVMQALGKLSQGAAKNMIAGAVAIGVVAAAMIVLAGALLLFKLIDWGSMGKAGAALLGISVAVGALALIPYAGIAKVGLAMLTASVGMIALANALILFDLVNWTAMAKAGIMMVALAISLAVIMAVGGPASAATLLALAGAMIGLALACIIFNNVEWASIAKATVVLTVLLAALAVGAVILTVFLYAIAPVAPVLIILAAGFFLLGLGLLAFAAAMAIAITLGAAGVAAFAALATGAAVAVAVFLQTLALQAPIMKDSFLKILQTLIDTIVESVPMIIQGFKDLWKAVMNELISPAKKKDMQRTGQDWIDVLYESLNKNMPRIVDYAGRLVVKFILGMQKNAADIAAAGVGLIVEVLKGITSKLGDLQKAGADLIIKWITGMATQYARIADAAAKAVIQFINNMSKAIDNNSEALGRAMGNLGVQMVKGLITGIASMAGEALNEVKNLAGNMVSAAKDKLKIFSPSRVFKSIGKFLVEGLTNGIQENAASAIVAVASMVGGQIAVASAYVSKFVQGLDQQAIAARAKADGLASAAAKAAKAADAQQKRAAKTKKNKEDDKQANRAAKAADRIDKQAAKADKAAQAAENKSSKAAERADRQKEYEQATLLEKAQMRSEDAQGQMDAAKAAERRAAADLAEANALDRQAKAKGVSAKDRKALEKEADRLRRQAKIEAAKANANLKGAGLSAADALRLQQAAGAEAAKMFQDAYEADAKSAADDAAFDKLSNTEKAKLRREQAAALKAKADKDIADAKVLAYTDLEAANALAEQAIAEAARARDMLEEAQQYEDGTSGPGGASGAVTNLDMTDAAAVAVNNYADLYDSAYAAASRGSTVEFNQTIVTPDASDPVEVYRRTDNLLTYAGDKLIHPAA